MREQLIIIDKKVEREPLQPHPNYLELIENLTQKVNQIQNIEPPNPEHNYSDLLDQLSKKDDEIHSSQNKPPNIY